MKTELKEALETLKSYCSKNTCDVCEIHLFCTEVCIDSWNIEDWSE